MSNRRGDPSTRKVPRASAGAGWGLWTVWREQGAGVDTSGWDVGRLAFVIIRSDCLNEMRVRASMMNVHTVTHGRC